MQGLRGADGQIFIDLARVDGDNLSIFFARQFFP